MAVLALLVAGCAQGSGTPGSLDGGIYGVEVSGAIGTEPTVRIAAPLTVTKSQTEAVLTGTGPAVAIDQLFVLELTLYDARTGKRAASTYDAGQVPVVTKSTADTLFPALSAALLGKRQGSRVVVSLRGADAFGSGGVPPAGVRREDPIVVVADVLSVPPAVTITDPRGTAHRLSGPVRAQTVAGDPTAITGTSTTRAPRTLRVITLIDGDGPPVRTRSLITINYLGQDWGSAEPFADTYFKEPALVPVGAGISMPAWDRALVGVRRGSRLLIIDPHPPASVPGADARHRHGTIAWVVDVLGVS